MPARTNDFQAVVFFVKKHIARNATVVESGMLTDRITGELREVDVAITATVAGHDLTIGIECRAHVRPQGVEWVEQVASKHERLPINQTVMVSRSGFTKTAKALAAKLGIELVTPGLEISDQGPLAGLGVQVEAREVSWSGDVRVLATLRDGDQQPVQTALAPGGLLFAGDGTAVGTVMDLVRQVREDVESRAETALADEDAKWLVLEIEPLQAEHPRPGEWTPVHLKHRGQDLMTSAIERLEVALAIDVRIAPVELTFGGLQGVEFATGASELQEHRALVVVTDGDGSPRTSVRVTDRDGRAIDLGDESVTRVQVTPEQRERIRARHTQGPDSSTTT